MPSIADRLGADMSNYTSATMKPTPSTPTSVTSTDQEPGLNIYLRCPLPPIWQSSPDALRQFYNNNRVPQTRLFNPVKS